jgi:multiple sugar transport system substrate-binding protein
MGFPDWRRCPDGRRFPWSRGAIDLLELAVFCLLVLLLFAPFTCRRKPPTDDITIRVWASPYPETKPFFLEAIALFEKQNPGIKVKFESTGNRNPREKYVVAMQAGSCADVLWVHWTATSMLASKRVLEPLDEWIRKENYDMTDFFASGIEAYKYKDRLYVLPFKGSCSFIFYNKDLFDRAHVAYPTDKWTWDDLLEAAKKLTVRDEHGRAVQVGLQPYGIGYWVYSAGGEFANDDCTELYFTRPKTLEGLRFYTNLRNLWKVTSRDMGDDPTGMDVFEKGNVAMILQGPWNFWKYMQVKDLRWDIELYPIGPSGQRRPLYAGMGFAMWSGSRNKEAAWKFVKFICDKDAGDIIFSRGFLDLPGRKSLLDVFAKQSAPFNMDVVVKSMDPKYDNVCSLPRSEKWPDVKRFFDEEFEAVLLGRQELEPGMRKAELLARQFLERESGNVTWTHYAGLAALVTGIVGVAGWRTHLAAGKKGRHRMVAVTASMPAADTPRS